LNKKSSNKKGVAHFASRFIVSYRQGIVTSIQSHKSQCYKDNVIKVISAYDYKKAVASILFGICIYHLCL